MPREARRATIGQLAFMTYAVVCSGAYGLEPMVSAAGPGLALTVLLVMPVVYAAPIALACAELAARHPVEGGYYRWVRLAFGDGAGFVAAWLMWITMFATNASFAVLFGSYVRTLAPALTPAAQFAIVASLVWAAVWLNWRGIRFVGAASMIFTVLILVPFALMTVGGLAQWQQNPLRPFARPDASLIESALAATMIAVWLYGGFEKLTVNAGEVESPQRAFKVALLMALPACAASYLVPTIGALAAGGDWRRWSDGYFVTAAAAIGGPALGSAMAVGALVSNTGLLTVTILSQSRLPMVLADDGLFPRLFGRRDGRFGTPVISLVVAGVVLTALVGVPFVQLASTAALVQSAAYVLLYAALIRLRRLDRSDEPPAFRIPLGTSGLLLMSAPSVAISALTIGATLFPDGAFAPRRALLAAAVAGAGVLTYTLGRQRRRASRTPDTPQDAVRTTALEDPGAARWPAD